MKADLIIRSNSIFDSIHEDPFCGYIAIKGNRIISVDKASDGAELIGDNTVLREFGDNTVMAGFHDSHIHLIMAGLFKTHVNLADARTEEEAVQLIKDAVDRGEETGKWILGFSWYHVFWGKQTDSYLQILRQIFSGQTGMSSQCRSSWRVGQQCSYENYGCHKGYT